MRATTRDWLTFAQKDLVNCERILDDEFLTNIVAFHAQQAVEKGFKAIIEEFELGFIRTHDLIRLSEIVEPHIPFEFDENMLATLNEVYIVSRYPGELGILPHGNPTTEDAHRFYRFAQDIFERIQAYLLEQSDVEQTEEQNDDPPVEEEGDSNETSAN
jgi:HEPN domain-containing protein